MMITDDDDKCNDGHDDDNCNDDDDDDDDDDDCLSPRELEGSREVRKSEEEVFNPAKDDQPFLMFHQEWFDYFVLHKNKYIFSK